MGEPIVCSRQGCNEPNGLLQEECRKCGHAISRNGIITRKKGPGSSPPSASWETENIPDIWRSANSTCGTLPEINAHEYLIYCLLLRAMQQKFDIDDKKIWFDDAIFFLRGGYDFFTHLNTTSELRLRGRIFGGLNHGKRPSIRVGKWIKRLFNEAIARNIHELDVFVAEEANSGSSTHQIMNLMKKCIKRFSKNNSYTLSICFHYYIATANNSKFDQAKFGKQVKKKRNYQVGNIQVINQFTLFRGYLLSYDSEIFSGLKVLSNGNDFEERYGVIKYKTPYINFECPDCKESIFDCYPGNNDVSNLVGVLFHEITGNLGSHISKKVTKRITNNGCPICKKYFELLLSSSKNVWNSVKI